MKALPGAEAGLGEGAGVWVSWESASVVLEVELVRPSEGVRVCVVEVEVGDVGEEGEGLLGAVDER